MGDLIQVDCFTVGGGPAGPSMPGPRLQQMLGSRIEIDIVRRQLMVPTKRGIEIARQGDRIILWSNDDLEVEHADP